MAAQVVRSSMINRNLHLGASQILGCREDWEKLRRRERGQVLRSARRGKEHPDPRIARIAYGWALSITPSEPNTHEHWWAAANLLSFGLLLDIIGTLFGAALGGEGFGGALGGVLIENKQKRYAQKIISIRTGKCPT
jgi:hypothetical protein